jgi:integrase
VKFTQTNVKALVLPAGKVDHIEWETGTGLGYRLRLGADGKTINRTWVVQYRHGGHTRRMSQPAGKLDAESARKWAKSVNAQVVLGHDPSAEKQAAAKTDTFKVVVADYLRYCARKVRPRSFTEKSRYLTGWYFKPLHNLALNQITRADVARALDRIDLKSRAIVCARARAQLSALFAWSLARGLCQINAVLGTSRPESAPPRTRVLSNVELVAIWRACEADTDYGRCVRLLILTGCRRQEVGGIRWSEIDGQNWTLPASRSKNRHEHQLPLMPAMREILARVAKRASSDCLFGMGERGFVAWSSSKLELDARAKLAAPWRLHDLRRTVRTRLADLGVLPHVAEMILNHRDRSSVERTYDLSHYEAEVLAALARWHAHVLALVEDGEAKAA